MGIIRSMSFGLVNMIRSLLPLSGNHVVAIVICKHYTSVSHVSNNFI
jgi:hypothetical protein